MIGRAIDIALRIFSAAPILCVLAIWWYGGSLWHQFLDIGTTHRLLLWTVFSLSLAIVLTAIAHESGVIERIWPKTYHPNMRTFAMDILDKFTNKERLERILSGAVQAERFDADACSTALKSRIVGQDAVCDAVTRVMRRRLGQVQRTKPVGVFLFAGPPGVGKTEFAKVLADYLSRGFIFEDMTQCGTPEKVSTIFGSPKGYVGSDTYGTLTAALLRSPRAVVLLDEMEKAHPSIQTRFLTAWNDGFVTEASDNKKIPANQAIFIATTNAAWEAIEEAKKSASDPDDIKVATVEVLKDAGFRPEVLSRIDDVFVFESLSGLDIARLAVLQINSFVEKYGLKLAQDGNGIDAAVLAEAMQRSQKLQRAGGARAAAKLLEDKLGDKLLDAKDDGAKTVRITLFGSSLDDIVVERA